MQKTFPSVLPKRVCPVSLRMHNKSAQRKPAKHKKTTRGKIPKRSSTIVSKTYNLEAKKRHSGVRRRLTAHECYYSSRHQPFALIGSSLSSFLLLCTTKIRLPSQLQSRNFQSITHLKIPRTKLIHLRRR